MIALRTGASLMPVRRSVLVGNGKAHARQWHMSHWYSALVFITVTDGASTRSGDRGSFPEGGSAGNSRRVLGLFTSAPKGVK